MTVSIPCLIQVLKYYKVFQLQKKNLVRILAFLQMEPERAAVVLLEMFCNSPAMKISNWWVQTLLNVYRKEIGVPQDLFADVRITM